MTIPPLQAAGQALAAGAAVRTAASAVSGTFERLLRSAGESGPSESGASSQDQKDTASKAVDAPPGADGSLNVPALRQQTEALIRSFHGRVQHVLRENGIDLQGGVKLALDDFGRIRVSGAHPQKEQIEQLLATRPELGQMLQSIATRFRLLETVGQLESQSLFPDRGAQTFELRVDAQRAEPSLTR